MHKTMLKVSISLLLLSAIIYACGEYTHTIRELERYNQMTSTGQEELTATAKLEVERFEPKPEAVKEKAPLVTDIQDLKFLDIKGLAPPSDRKVRAGMMTELRTGRHLWAKNVLAKIPIASLSKIMTVLVVLDEVDRRENVTLDTKIKITSKARTTRSSSFLRKHPLPEVSVRECLQSALIKSANDSCVLLADYFGDGEDRRFAAMMNAKARALKMKDTVFYNPHGLPGAYYTPETPDNTSSVRDLMYLVIEVVNNRPDLFNWTRLPSITTPKNHSRAITINNTNPLIKIDGVIGLKTGFTTNAGWCLINVDRYNGKFYVSIITGCPSKAARNSFANALLRWGRKAGATLK